MISGGYGDFRLISGRTYLQCIITGKIKEQHKEHIKKVFDNNGVVIVADMHNLVGTGSRSGRRYMYQGVAYTASAPGEAPAKRSGQLYEAFGFNASWNELRIWNNARSEDGKPYPLFLDEGTRKMNARPFFLVTIAKHEGNVKSGLQNYKGD